MSGAPALNTSADTIVPLVFTHRIRIQRLNHLNLQHYNHRSLNPKHGDLLSAGPRATV